MTQQTAHGIVIIILGLCLILVNLVNVMQSIRVNEAEDRIEAIEKRIDSTTFTYDVRVPEF